MQHTKKRQAMKSELDKIKYPDKISKYMGFEEAIRSQTADRYGYDNRPNAEQLKNMKFVAKKVFDPVREFVGGPVTCSSFFRSPGLNTLIGGSTRSFHCHGAAIDIKLFSDCSYAEVFEFIKDNLTFSELIWEFGNDDQPAWVHVAYLPGDVRKMVKKVQKVGKRNVWFDLVGSEWTER